MNISEQIQGTTGHNGARENVVRDIVFTCVVVYNIMIAHQHTRAEQTGHPTQ